MAEGIMQVSGTRALVASLDRAKHRFDPPARAEKILALRALAQRPIRDPSLLIRFHEVLCFLQAYPDDGAALDLVEQALRGFEARVRLAAAGQPAARRRLRDTGIVGTTIQYPFGYPMARWLARAFPGAAEIAWDEFTGEERLREVLALLVAPPEQDALDDERVPTRKWIRAAKGPGSQTDLAWLVGLFDDSPIPQAAKDHLFETLDLPIRWRVEGPASRTLAKLPSASIVFQRGPLRRRVGSLRRAVRQPLPVLRAAAGAEGRRVIEAARCALSVRHRELYGLEHANPRETIVAEMGQGVQVVLIGVAPDFRLPLEGVYSFLVLKSGVPVGYGAGTILFERLEVALNIFESFRQGESAFLFAQVLRAFHHYLGVSAILVDRYQIGYQNPEAIASGAFWFFYKLGFRPADPGLARLARREAGQIAGQPGYRSSRPMLIHLSRGDMLLDLRGRRDWGIRGFRAGALGVLVSRSLAGARGRSRGAAVRAAVARVARALNVARRQRWPRSERAAFEKLALALVPLHDLGTWPAAQKRRLVRALRARGRPSERQFLAGVRSHTWLRRAIWRCVQGAGSISKGGGRRGDRRGGMQEISRHCGEMVHGGN